MTTQLAEVTAPAWLCARSDRCSNCGCHPTAQGHIAPCTPSGPLADRLAGERARDVGMARTVAAHPDAVAVIDAAIMRRVRAGVTFSANTIRAELTMLAPNERNCIGARMNSLARRHCSPVGEEPSTDVATHGKKVTRWQPKSVAA